MKTSALGRLGWPVSFIGLGGIAIQRLDDEAAAAVVVAALATGVNFIDSARGYTDSEAKIGKGIRGIERERFFLATKSMERTAEGLLADIAKSRANLGVDMIDLYQLHNVKDDASLDQVLALGGALEGAEEARRRGWIRAVGITGHVTSVLEKAIATGHFATCQFPYNVIETRVEERLLPACVEQDLGIIVMKPLAGGALGPDWAEQSLRFFLDKPVSVVIPGMDSLEQVVANCRVGQAGHPLTAEETAQVQEALRSLGERFCRRCEYCMPCPHGVNIPVTFLLHGYWTRYNLQDWAQERYGAMAVKADACRECRVCEARCPYDLPIREMLKEAHANLDDPGLKKEN
ncbi:aldo/keto reductase [Heliobacterium gestii]|uniref:Aldo/keto reductase n=1 Tax=Heliomicrobium gestii TaxID=2699 RepID=A0A845LA79_HELGE|nr:aldo/keto reductase [Heliomicrobium gestii]MBM7866775.1 putative aldo/keto reductase-like oxidoreductase [Heliomicrobium gestii]MZP42204.1 aldo/keto reductase [Heliomicrobium gestii]